MENIEQLAEELHRFYRAAFKSLHSGYGTFMGVGRVRAKEGTMCRGEHDHGWSHCNKQAYFRKRAEMILRDTKVRAGDPSVLSDLAEKIGKDMISDLHSMEGKHNKAYDLAIAAECQVFWADGILGPRWHCGCTNGPRHYINQQCSVVEFYKETQ